MKNTCIILFIILFSNGIYAQEKMNVASKNVVQFIEANEAIIPLEDRFRRKFDNAVIADLDQDGYLDLSYRQVHTAKIDHLDHRLPGLHRDQYVGRLQIPMHESTFMCMLNRSARLY